MCKDALNCFLLQFTSTTTVQNTAQNIISTLTSDKHQSSDIVYRRRGALTVLWIGFCHSGAILLWIYLLLFIICILCVFVSCCICIVLLWVRCGGPDGIEV